MIPPASPEAPQLPEFPHLFARTTARALARIVPGIDWLRVWRGDDLASDDQPFEAQLAQRHRSIQPVIGVATLALFGLGVWATYGLGAQFFEAHRSDRTLSSVLVALAGGFFLHGAFAFVVHEGTHHNLLKRPIDRWISNAALGLMLLPFASERYQTLHLYHHKRVLDLDDPNWTDVRDRLWRKARILYVVYELLPLANNLERLFTQQPKLVGSSRVDLQACKLEYSIVSPK